MCRADGLTVSFSIGCVHCHLCHTQNTQRSLSPCSRVPKRVRVEHAVTCSTLACRYLVLLAQPIQPLPCVLSAVLRGITIAGGAGGRVGRGYCHSISIGFQIASRQTSPCVDRRNLPALPYAPRLHSIESAPDRPRQMIAAVAPQSFFFLSFFPSPSLSQAGIMGRHLINPCLVNRRRATCQPCPTWGHGHVCPIQSLNCMRESSNAG